MGKETEYYLSNLDDERLKKLEHKVKKLETTEEIMGEALNRVIEQLHKLQQQKEQP